MRILFIGGFYRGQLLAQRLLERGEQVVGGFVFEEDAHETVRYCDQIVERFAAQNIWVEKTRRITNSRLDLVRDQLKPDVVFVLGWRTMIPTEVLEAAPQGGVAVHDSLLPRLRGFAPTNWGMILGHEQLGATLFQLADDVDAGDIYFQESIRPEPQESFASIQQRIAKLSVRLFDSYLDASMSGTLVGCPQDHSQATYTCARGPVDGEIDWTATSTQVGRLVRALASPAPGAFTFYRGERIVVDQARAVDRPPQYEGRVPGKIIGLDCLTGAVDVLCGEGVLRITRITTADGLSVPATSVIKSVRESMGLNTTQEILLLRDRISQLELLLEGLELGIPRKKAG